MPSSKRSVNHMQGTSALVPATTIGPRIVTFRGRDVMFDADLARLYGVDTRILNQAVRRNPLRFPEDFTFQVTIEDLDSLRSQTVISNSDRGGRRYLPYAFTEHGAVMLASVLNSPAAIAASLEVVRAFVRLRTLIGPNRELARKLATLERKSDRRFKIVFDTIRRIVTPRPASRRRIGFTLPPKTGRPRHAG